MTTEPESRVWLENLNRNIDTLEKRVDDVLENIRIGGRYDENIEKLDNNIYILTELIQENIQYYIYYQTRSMEEVNENLHRRIQSFIIICGVLAALLAAAVIAVTFFVTSEFSARLRSCMMPHRNCQKEILMPMPRLIPTMKSKRWRTVLMIWQKRYRPDYKNQGG